MIGDLNRFFIDILNSNLSVRFDAIAAIESTCISLYTSTDQILPTDHSFEPSSIPIGPLKKSFRIIINHLVGKVHPEKCFRIHLFSFLKNQLFNYIDQCINKRAAADILAVGEVVQGNLDLLLLTKETIISMRESFVSNKSPPKDKYNLTHFSSLLLQSFYNEYNNISNPIITDFVHCLLGMSYIS